MNNITIFKSNFLNKESTLSEFATSSSKAIRLINEDISNEIRPPFFHDIDRIIYSLSYTRYLDKTQVFTDSGNDNISKRITHVQFVSKVARTIGRALNLNEDLIEAIALGHDIGHTPLGHSGEAMLNEISLRELGEYFAHNIESVRDLMFIENNGEGLNLTIQVYDGIMCHNGEILEPIYRPQEKDIEEFLREYNLAYKDLQASKKFRPMTLEGCVVRISDIIGYIGRGSTNREIINNIIMDIINNSLNKPYIKLSEKVFKAIFELKRFNYEHIYKYSLTEKKRAYYKEGMNRLFKNYLTDIKNNNKNSEIYTVFLNNQSSKYNKNTSEKRKVIDFIAGMTDDYFIKKIDNL